MKYLQKILFGSLLASSLTVSAQDKLSFDQPRGTVHDQVIKIGAGSQSAELPVRIIKGKKDGPVFSIVAGIHGYEYPPIMAVQEIMAELDAEKLAGTLLIVPIANVNAFYGRSVFYNPADGKNLNRVFPGREKGSVSEQLAHVITREVIDRSEVFLDIHAGDASEDLIDFVCYYNNEATPQQTALARTLAESAGFPYLVTYPFNLSHDQPAEYAFKQAMRQGVTALSLEAGKLGNVQRESVTRIKQAIYNMLAELKMYRGSERKVIAKPVELDGQSYVRSPEQGIFYSSIKSGDSVAKGQHLGYITDVFGKKLTEIYAPQSGLILYKIGTPPVQKGETVFCLGYKK